MTGRTMIYPSFGNLPTNYRSDCMEKLAPGVYRHLRLDVVFVIEQDINEQQAATLEHIEADIAATDSQRNPLRFLPTGGAGKGFGEPVEINPDDILFARLGR